MPSPAARDARQTLAIAIPTYNRVDLLLELLGTIPPEYPVHVSDNGGFFSSARPTESLGDRINIAPTDTVVPMFANWQRAAFAAAEASDYFVIPSDDDTFCPGAFASIQRAIDANPDVGMFIFGHNLIDEHGHRIGGWRPEQRLLAETGKGFSELCAGIAARCPAIVLKSETFKRLGGFDTGFKLSAADSWLIQKMALNGQVLFEPEVVANYRVWPHSFTSTQLGGVDWMTDILRWVAQLKQELVGRHGYSPRQASKFGDRIVVDNLVAGLNNEQSRKAVALKFTFKHYVLPNGMGLVALARLMKSVAKASIVSLAGTRAPRRNAV